MTEFNRGKESLAEASSSLHTVTHTQGEPPVSMQLETSIPSPCAGCDTAYDVCAKFARQVIKEKMTLEEAGESVAADLGENCPGMITRPGGWGMQSRSCCYTETK